MKAIVILLVVLTVLTTIINGQSAGKNRPSSVGSGKYRDFSSKSNDDGKYKASKWNKGRYVHMVQPYVHTSDHRELGIYHHIYNPYGGGYGPYSGSLIPPIPYKMDNAGDYKLYTTTTTTTQRPTTTTTQKPRFVNYHEEGGWRILHQQELKTKKKYDFVYHTENGIYGQEKAHVHDDHGLMSAGFYEYTGDDGQIYRVNYKGGKHGFMPEGDHIPKTPEHIRKALEFVEKKKQIEEAQGIFRPHDNGKYVHRDYSNRKARLQNMDIPNMSEQIKRPLDEPQSAPMNIVNDSPMTQLEPMMMIYQEEQANQQQPEERQLVGEAVPHQQDSPSQEPDLPVQHGQVPDLIQDQSQSEQKAPIKKDTEPNDKTPYPEEILKESSDSEIENSNEKMSDPSIPSENTDLEEQNPSSSSPIIL